MVALICFVGDRIAIMSQGSLLCCGSFEYLKHHFGGGHRLILVQSDRKQSLSSRTTAVTAIDEEPLESAEATSPSTDDCIQPSLRDNRDESAITNFVQEIVAGASVIERRGQEIHYHLPLLHARPHTLAHLFSQLDKKKEGLGVLSYGLNSCTMEEV